MLKSPLRLVVMNLKTKIKLRSNQFTWKQNKWRIGLKQVLFFFQVSMINRKRDKRVNGICLGSVIVMMDYEI